MAEEKKNNEPKGIKINIQSESGTGSPGNMENSAEESSLPIEELTKEELIERIKELQIKVVENYDLYLRSQADIENIKKRYQKDKIDLRLFANEKLIKELLPAVDNLQKAIEISHNENSMDALRKGLELTLKGLKATFEDAGLEEVKAEGESFDPCFHEAISMQQDDGCEAGEILQELQKGYMLNQRLIRPALVIVNKGTSEGTQELPSDAVCEADKE